VLALTDQALAHLCIAASAIPPRRRDKWLRKIARQVDPPRQTRYYRRRHHMGMVCVRPEVDPDALAALLCAAGIFVLARDRETLKLGIEELVRRFEEGRLAISTCNT
jgi:hypothetical protein